MQSSPTTLNDDVERQERRRPYFTLALILDPDRPDLAKGRSPEPCSCLSADHGIIGVKDRHGVQTPELIPFWLAAALAGGVSFIIGWCKLGLPPLDIKQNGQCSSSAGQRQTGAHRAQGRVRTKTVKRSSRVLIEKYYPRLTLDFQ